MADPPGSEPEHSSLEGERPQEFEKAKDDDLPVAYLVPLEALERFRKFTDLILDLGQKHKKKDLGSYLLDRGNDRVPIIDGDYSASGQAKRSVREFLVRASDKKEQAFYIIGIEEMLFDDLWEKAGSETTNRRYETRKVKKAQEPASSSDLRTSSWVVQELLKKCSVPSDLADSYVGESDQTVFVRVLISLAAKSHNPVLIIGDTGTGKEIVSREIHGNSLRSSSQFIPVNCGGIPRNLFESELFGHKKGAFTDAIQDKKGLWEVAGNGTLFLDEIGDLHAEHQVKILRALEEKKIRRVGDTREIEVNARVIAATNQDLFSMVRNGKFREDLYYRLAILFINTPSLRDHPDDVPLLADHFWKKATQDKHRVLPREIVTALQSYPLPGNVRHLKTVLGRLNDMFRADPLTVRHLQAVLDMDGQSTVTGESPVSEKDIMLHRAQCLKHLKRVHEVVNAIQFTLQLILESHKTDGSAPEPDRISLSLRFQDLEMLCRNQLLFYSQKLSDEISGLKGKIGYLLGVLDNDFKGAEQYWAVEMSEAFKQALSAIFKEIENVMREK